MVFLEWFFCRVMFNRSVVSRCLFYLKVVLEVGARDREKERKLM